MMGARSPSEWQATLRAGLMALISATKAARRGLFKPRHVLGATSIARCVSPTSLIQIVSMSTSVSPRRSQVVVEGGVEDAFVQAGAGD